MMLLANVKPQFQPRNALDVRAVVLAKRNTPVMTAKRQEMSLMSVLCERAQGGAGDARVEMARVPLRPR